MVRAVWLAAIVWTVSVATGWGQQEPEAAEQAAADHMPGTQLLETEGDMASAMVDGVDRFLMRKIEQAAESRQQRWRRDISSLQAYADSVEPQRSQLRRMLGLRDERATFEHPQVIARGLEADDRIIARGGGEDGAAAYEVLAISWPTVGDVRARGLLLQPVDADGTEPLVIAIGDADQTPEQIAGLTEGVPRESQFARRLAESGVRVVAPVLIDRDRGGEKVAGDGGRSATITSREFLHRSAYELGRTLTGYEIQAVLGLVDWAGADEATTSIGVMGWGEGGRLALYAAAMDERIDAAAVSGYFGPRERMWNEPADRNVFGLLRMFADAEVATLLAGRSLIIEAARGPELALQGGKGKPATLTTPPLAHVKAEVARAAELVAGLETEAGAWSPTLIASGEAGDGPYGTERTLTAFLAALGEHELQPTGLMPRDLREDFAPRERQITLLREIDRHNQQLLAESDKVRREDIWSRFDTESVQAYERSIEPLRRKFRDEVIGRFDDELLDPNPRTRLVERTEQWTRYEVVLDVFDDVFAYGLLTIPNDIAEGERRPVVVCQHGLEGRPRDTIGDEAHGYYKAFATELAERGYVTFAPQNLYIFGDRFRMLQFKANPLGKTLFSVMVPQHQQIVNWLGGLEMVDAERIGFYGLSYGGKSAMRIPPLVEGYALSICSADFNDWVDKNASTTNPRSYMWTGEYEIFEWNLGSTFNYAEIAALIAPRPFMVERGHFDAVADDWTVAWEFAKVRLLYQGMLGIGDRCEIEWFDGPHTIHGQGTYEFLDRFLMQEE